MQIIAAMKKCKNDFSISRRESKGPKKNETEQTLIWIPWQSKLPERGQF